MDVVSTLQYMQENGLIRLNKVTGDYYSVYCPLHNEGKERRPSAGVLLHSQYRNGQSYPDGWFHCFTCQKALNIRELVEETLKLHTVTQDVRDRLHDLLGSYESTDSEKLFSSEFIKSLEAKYAVNAIRSRVESNFEYVSEEELKNYRFTIPYMYERKLTDYIIDKYDVGVDLKYVPEGGKREVPCITFPVRDHKGRTLFILRRAVSIKRFYMPSNVQKPVYGIFELPKDAKSVVVVESCFNALTSVRYGRPAVALLGTGTPYQIEQLRRLGVKEFILGFDPDAAGQAATKKLKRSLKDIAFVWEFNGIPVGKDINDLSEEEFKNLEIV